MINYPNEADPLFYEQITDKIFLMDDHKWAFFFWKKYSNQTSYILLHLDFHWDGINDFHFDKSMAEKLKHFTIDELKDFIEKDHYIKFDSFIAPAITTNIFKEVHFLCYQQDTTIGLDDELLINNNSQQFFHKNINDAILALDGIRVAFDLDLDIFNKSDMFQEGDLWKEDEIIRFLKRCEKIISNSPIITIAMSYNYSGTQENTKYLTELTLPIIQTYSEKVF